MPRPIAIPLIMALLGGFLPLGNSSKASVSGLDHEMLDLKELKKRERAMRQKWRPKCNKVWGKRTRLDDIFASDSFSKRTLLQIADRFIDGRNGCRKSPELALRLFEYTVGSNPIDAASGDTLKTMIYLYGLLKVPHAEDKIVQLRRILWLQGRFYGGEKLLKWDLASKRSFTARDDIWRYITSKNRIIGRSGGLVIEAYFDPLSPRYNPVKGIELAENSYFSDFKIKAAILLIQGKEVPEDTARAEKILWASAKYSTAAQQILLPLVAPKLDSFDILEASDAANSLFKIALDRNRNTKSANAIRQALVPFYAKRMQAIDPEISGDAINKLTEMVAAKTEAAMKPLHPWIDQRLRGKDIEQKRLAWRKLGALVRSGNSSAKDLLDEDIKRTGGVIDVDYLDGVKKTRTAFITSNDYPSRAIREEREGTVSIDLLLSPGGIAIEGFPADDIEPLLTKAVTRLAIRRLRYRELPSHKGRYIRVKLPDVQFRIFPCHNDFVATPEKTGAIIVNWRC